jgi:hypothetical protein
LRGALEAGNAGQDEIWRLQRLEVDGGTGHGPAEGTNCTAEADDMDEEKTLCTCKKWKPIKKCVYQHEPLPAQNC